MSPLLDPGTLLFGGDTVGHEGVKSACLVGDVSEVLSVQYRTSNNMSMAEVIKVTNFTERLAAVSSILGMVIFLRGATLDLAKVQKTLLELSSRRV